MIAIHVLEVVIVGSAVALVMSARPAYNVRDVFVIIAVGMIAGAIYALSINRLIEREKKRLKKSYPSRNLTL